MENLALYRKYRPQSFNDVLGQDHIIGILKNAVKLERVSHAYLFSGPRGTGKTSTARLLAKEVGIADIDLIEIDAASSRGIDEIRALRDAVRFAPLQSKYKVYIIDEVHMLTKEAFNALLKTLEEPPKHVIFILATTELEKVPETIISRCQTFSFHKIPESTLREAVIKTAKKEGFDLDNEAAGLIALFAEGSFRDAQGLLDKLFGMGEKKIIGARTREILSAPSRDLVEDFILSIVEKNGEKGITAVNQTIEKNIDSNLFIKLILRDIRALLIMKLAPNLEKQLAKDLGEREFAFLMEQRGKLEQREVENALKILLESFQARSNPYLPQLPVELALAKIISLNTQHA